MKTSEQQFNDWAEGQTELNIPSAWAAWKASRELLERQQELYDHLKALREAYGYESWTEVLTLAENRKTELEKLRADNASKNGQLKAFGKQVSVLSRTIRNRDRRLAKLEK